MTSRFNVLRAAAGFGGWEPLEEDEPVVTNAVQALYGAKQALTGNVGAQDRPQEVLTPPYIVEASLEALGVQAGDLFLDPCAAADPQHWIGTINWHLPLEAYAIETELKETTDKKLRAVYAKELKAVYLAGPGLVRPWFAPAFVNHPYKYSKEWMAKLVHEFLKGEYRKPSVMLCPVRPWRTWWVKYARVADECVWLAPVTFVGHKQPAPMPMCVLTYGCLLPSLGKQETGRSKI